MSRYFHYLEIILFITGKFFNVNMIFSVQTEVSGKIVDGLNGPRSCSLDFQFHPDPTKYTKLW